jgi:hypothetical protein
LLYPSYLVSSIQSSQAVKSSQVKSSQFSHINSVTSIQRQFKSSQIKTSHGPFVGTMNVFKCIMYYKQRYYCYSSILGVNPEVGKAALNKQQPPDATNRPNTKTGNGWMATTNNDWWLRAIRWVSTSHTTPQRDGDTWVPSYPIWAPPRCAISYFLHSGMAAHT